MRCVHAQSTERQLPVLPVTLALIGIRPMSRQYRPVGQINKSHVQFYDLWGWAGGDCFHGVLFALHPSSDARHFGSGPGMCR